MFKSLLRHWYQKCFIILSSNITQQKFPKLHWLISSCRWNKSHLTNKSFKQWTPRICQISAFSCTRWYQRSLVHPVTTWQNFHCSTIWALEPETYVSRAYACKQLHPIVNCEMKLLIHALDTLFLHQSLHISPNNVVVNSLRPSDAYMRQ